MKTEPVPDNTGKNVLDVTSMTMEDIVYNSGRDTFIVFYKPHCSHCREMMPTWMEFGEAMAKEDIDVIRINMEANEIPPEFKTEFQVKEYPTIFFKVRLQYLRREKCCNLCFSQQTQRSMPCSMLGRFHSGHSCSL